MRSCGALRRCHCGRRDRGVFAVPHGNLPYYGKWPAGPAVAEPAVAEPAVAEPNEPKVAEPAVAEEVKEQVKEPAEP